MKYWRLLYLSILSIVACTNQNNTPSPSQESKLIIIEGVLENGSNTLLTLDLMEPNEFVPIDSTRCDENGNFAFSFPGEGVNYYSLKYTEEGYVTLIAEPGNTIYLKGRADSIYPYEIKGSPASNLLRELGVSHRKILDQLLLVSQESIEILGDPNYSEKKLKLDMKFDSIAKTFHDYSQNFIFSNPSSPAIIIALYNQFGPENPVFHPIDDFDIYRFVDSALYANFPENEAVRSLHSNLAAAVQQLKNQQHARVLTNGMSAPDFVLESPEGNMLTLSDLRGKYVLLQIWATWSKPSVEENVFLKECYKRFGPDNFEILQISIDSEKENWMKAINEQNLVWSHASDLRRWGSAVVNLYGIERIPANFLIHPNGKIVEMDKFGEDLIPALEKYLN